MDAGVGTRENTLLDRGVTSLKPALLGFSEAKGIMPVLFVGV